MFRIQVLARGWERTNSMAAYLDNSYLEGRKNGWWLKLHSLTRTRRCLVSFVVWMTFLLLSVFS